MIELKGGKRSIYIDCNNKQEIENYLIQDEQHNKKWKTIAEVVLKGIRNTDLYDKEDINDKCKDVTAMKFFKRGNNDRIYCKEFTNGDKSRIVVASILHLKKKNQKNKAREITAINKVGETEYVIKEKCDN